MYFSGNFLIGAIAGAALAILAPLAATDLIAGPRVAASPQKFEIQTVNRAGKSDRLHNPQRATRDSDDAKPAKIPVGCDPAFSPLSKGARMNFSSRCLA
jgi:hypothetical protein